MSAPPKVALVAIPLMARSGVYRSAHDLVRTAREAGLDWTAIVGMRPAAAGTPLETPGVREVETAARGLAGVRQIRRILDEAKEVLDADVIVSLISQSDVALSKLSARTSRAWVAWVRGKPWPAHGEQSGWRRLLLRWLESRALRAADEVWATTPVLAQEFASVRSATIVPAGIAAVRRVSSGDDADSPLVWAGRIDVDKRPGLFAQIVELTGHPGRVFGDGPLRLGLSKHPVNGLTWEGWRDAAGLWGDASIFIGTSAREAFGRSAVEAAAAGLPLVIGSEYGAAPLLFTSPRFRDLCVIGSDDPAVWATAVRRLLLDRDLRIAVSEHVYQNAQALTIASSVAHARDRLQVVVQARRSH